jgi:nickel-dependent lactate racemase
MKHTPYIAFTFNARILQRYHRLSPANLVDYSRLHRYTTGQSDPFAARSSPMNAQLYHLQYGLHGLDIKIPGENVTVIRPTFVEGLPNEGAAFQEAVRNPIGGQPLREIIGANEQVAVVIPDGTRALPSDRLLPWLFAELSHVPAENFTVFVGTGTHRANTPEEIEGMVGREVVAKYRVVNHNAFDPEALVQVGQSLDGKPVWLNKAYVAADRRIVLGFIEPHFMAGFSGGYKGIFPAVAGIDSIMHYHRAEVIGHPRSTWGVMDQNPTQAQIQHNGSRVPVDFCINVTLNSERQITRFFCGDVLAAHAEGCDFAKATAMVPCPQRYPLVITSNSGYPLDQNLYQSFKGMSAAAQIVAEGGTIITVARCNDGFPAHGNFTKLVFEHDSAQAMLDTIMQPGFHMQDQWQAQLLALILLKAQVAVYSELEPDAVRRAHLEPIAELNSYIAAQLKRLGSTTPVAILPEGPLTIPYVDVAEPAFS